MAELSYRHLYPFQPHYLERNGYRYHYVDEGQGHPVVLVHGNPTWSFYYRGLIRGLAPTCRVIAPDHLGCGLSDKPSPRRYGYRMADRVADLTALLDHLDLDKVTLIVHDWGGAIGMAWAVRHARRVARLVVLNTAAFLKPAGKPLPIRLRLIREISWLAGPAVLGLNAFAVGAAHMAPRKKLERSVRAGLLAPYDCWDHRVATLKFVQDIPVHPGDPSYALVKFVEDGLELLAEKPMLICWGLKDFVFDRDYLAEWRRRFPRAEVLELSKAGHYLLEDAPGPILDRIRKFLEAHPIPRPDKAT